MHRHIVLTCTVLLSMVSAGITAGDDHYLDREILTVPTTGETAVTSASLEPYVVYRLTFASPLDLADIVNRRIDIYLTGSPAKILDFDTGLFDVVNHIYTLYQGTGKPLAIQLRAADDASNSSHLQDFAQRVPTIEASITRRHWWQHYRGTGVHPVVIRAVLLIIGVAIIGYVAYQHGPDALNSFIAQFNRTAQGGTIVPFALNGRRVQRRVRIVRENEEGGTDEP